MICNRRAKMFFVKHLAAGSALRRQEEKGQKKTPNSKVQRFSVVL